MTLESQTEVDADRKENLGDATQPETGNTPYLEKKFNPTIFNEYDTSTDDFWLCDSKHIYSVGTSVPNADINNLRLYENDIIIGMKATDTAGWFDWDLGTSFDADNSSAHKVAFNVYHKRPGKNKKLKMDNYHLAGGSNSTGQRFISFLPWEPGEYTIVFDETVASGTCAKPEMPRNRGGWVTYTVNILPPEENQASIPDWSEWADSDAYNDLLDSFYKGSGLFDIEKVEPVDLVKVVAGCGVLAGILILLFR